MWSQGGHLPSVVFMPIKLGDWTSSFPRLSLALNLCGLSMAAPHQLCFWAHKLFFIFIFWSWDHWVWWSLRSSKSSMACVFRSQHSNQATETRWSFLVHLTSIKELNALPSSNCRRKKFFFDKWYKFDLESLNRFLSYSLLVLEVLWWPQISFVILLALLHCYYVAPGSWSWWYEDWLPSGTWWHHALIW